MVEDFIRDLEDPNDSTPLEEPRPIVRTLGDEDVLPFTATGPALADAFDGFDSGLGVLPSVGEPFDFNAACDLESFFGDDSIYGWVPQPSGINLDASVNG